MMTRFLRPWGSGLQGKLGSGSHSGMFPECWVVRLIWSILDPYMVLSDGVAPGDIGVLLQGGKYKGISTHD